jgi:hypothetical protein
MPFDCIAKPFKRSAFPDVGLSDSRPTREVIASKLRPDVVLAKCRISFGAFKNDLLAGIN